MKFILKNWWKILSIVLILYSIIMGYLGSVPRMPILRESIRNVYFHVPMWIGMYVAFATSVFYSVKYLAKGRTEDDLMAVESANTGLVFFILGITSGMFWAYITWGELWSNDPKQNSAAIAFLLYCAYLILRSAMDEEQKRAKISAIYNIFAFPMMIALLIILPRLTDSLHPGNGGNPAFSEYLDGRMKMVLYPAFIGWGLMSAWVISLRFRIRAINEIKLFENEK